MPLLFIVEQEFLAMWCYLMVMSWNSKYLKLFREIMNYAKTALERDPITYCVPLQLEVGAHELAYLGKKRPSKVIRAHGQLTAFVWQSLF